LIVVHLIGGLGNQLFQYATGRHLEIRTGEELYFDISGFDKYKLHHYSLMHFRIRERFVTADELREYFGVGRSGILRIYRNWIADRKTDLQRGVIQERLSHHYDPDILNLKGNVYLKGYWQSEKYFAEIGQVIREDLTLAEPLDGRDLEIAELIDSCDSVSLHVRRKDYVIDAATHAKFGTCDLNYYRTCIDHLTGLLPNAHFFVFSDDPIWAAENLKIDHPLTVVDHNDASRNYADLMLMSRCKHNIIANSSFSWWGAWLNPNLGKMVFAPRRWLASPQFDTPDLIPSNWIKK